MEHSYKTKGVCPREISFTLDGNKVKNIQFLGGCDGNLKGIASLCDGLEKEDVIKKLTGIKCGRKETSCPDQLAKALSEN